MPTQAVRLDKVEKHLNDIDVTSSSNRERVETLFKQTGELKETQKDIDARLHREETHFMAFQKEMKGDLKTIMTDVNHILKDVEELKNKDVQHDQRFDKLEGDGQERFDKIMSALEKVKSDLEDAAEKRYAELHDDIRENRTSYKTMVIAIAGIGAAIAVGLLFFNNPTALLD